MKLKELRKMKKLSQKELGEMLNLADVTISRYEKGLFDPNIDTLIKMADIFGVSVDTLVGHDANIIDMSNLDKDRQMLINKIVYDLDDITVGKLIGFIEK